MTIKKKNKQVAQAVSNLTEDVKPAEWNSFLFGLQTQLITSDNFGTYTKKASQEFAYHFDQLRRFFDNLNEIKA